MLLLPYAIFRAAHVHIGRRVVGVARFGDPDHASAALSDTFLYVLATSASIDSSAKVQSYSNPTPPLTLPLVLACWLCSCANLSLRCLARTHTVSTSIVLACVRRSCGGVADGVLMQSLAGTLLFYYNVDWLPVATDHSPFRQRQIRRHLLPHLHMPLLSRSRMQPRGMLVRFPDVLAST